MRLKGIKKTILIVDDEKEVRDLIHVTLHNPEYRILETGDGCSALELVRRERPDLLMLDWMMPSMSGLEVAEALSSDPHTADIPIIMLTAIGADKDRQRAYEMGILAYIVKPFSPLELRERVRTLLE